MEINDLIGKKGTWLKGGGPRPEIVISTRMRLARNIAGHRFFAWSDNDLKERTLKDALAALRKVAHLKNALFAGMKTVSAIDREFLIERHLMSREHARDTGFKALVVDENEVLSVMVNEEDHFRIQVLEPGFDLTEAWRIIDDVDTRLSEAAAYAFSNKFGYLTSCPTNTGTGLRASVMVHLAALQMTGSIEKVYDSIAKLGLTVRGFYGEGSDASGDFFQISNQVTLGISEPDIIDNIERVARKVIAWEQDARDLLAAKKRQELEDNVFRSYGTLKSARIITWAETVKLLSIIRLGVAVGIVKDVGVGMMNELLLLTQPGHLQKLEGRELASIERDSKRADLIRHKLENTKV
jgi:protein arginine kinase